MFYTDDPIKDAERHDAYQTKRLEQLPVCADCGEHIQEEEAFERHGEYLCENCVDACIRRIEPYESI